MNYSGYLFGAIAFLTNKVLKGTDYFCRFYFSKVYAEFLFLEQP